MSSDQDTCEHDFQPHQLIFDGRRVPPELICTKCMYPVGSLVDVLNRELEGLPDANVRP